jgi:dihydrofolate reductase
VFTKTLNKSRWPNTRIATRDLTEEVNRPKNQTGKDIIVYGDASFVSSLIKAGLVDEYHLFVNPTALGNGITIFKDLNDRRKLAFLRSIAFPSGIVVLHYEPVGAKAV